jgi:N-acetylglucosaminyldiphosphoundecaprenol N-acetyl-beta-D-mannosaminyltransferase
MSLDAVKILGINITTNSKSVILEDLQKFIVHGSWFVDKKKKKTKKILTIVTPNPEQVICAQKDSHFQDILNRADIAIPDGIGLVFASRILQGSHAMSHASRIMKVIPGIEFMETLVLWAAKRRVPIALIGGRDGLAVKTLDCLSKQHPGLRNSWAEDAPEIEIENHELRIMNYGEHIETKNIVKNHASIPVATIRRERYFERLAETIRDHKTQIIFVGLGAPKQEYFIENLQTIINSQVSGRKSPVPVVLMSVGGSFDEISGRIPRAPQWVGRRGLKWLWRLILQPWRMGRQFALFKFIVLIVLERYRMK